MRSQSELAGRTEPRTSPWRQLAPLVAAAAAAQSLLVILGPTVVAIAGEFGVSVGVTAQARSVTGATAVIASLAITSRIDRIGVARLLAGGTLLAMAACAGIAASPVLSVFLAVHVVLGLGFACLASAGFAGVAAFPEEERAWAMGYVTSAIAGSWIVVNPVVGVLTEKVTWRVACLMPAVVAALALFLTRHASFPQGRREVTRVAQVLAVAPARRWVAAELTYYIAWAAFLTFSGAFYIQRLGTSEFLVGWVLALGPAAFVVAAVKSRFLAARLPRPQVVAVSALTIGAILMVMLAATNSIVAAAALNTLVGFVAGIRTPLSSTLGMAQLPDRPGAMMSIRTGINQLGYLLAGVIGGAVIDHWGYARFGVVLASVLVISAGQFLRVHEAE